VPGENVWAALVLGRGWRRAAARLARGEALARGRGGAKAAADLERLAQMRAARQGDKQPGGECVAAPATSCSSSCGAGEEKVAPPEQATAPRGIGETDVEAEPAQLAPQPAPAGRRLDRDRSELATEGHRPVDQLWRRGREPALGELAAIRVQDGGVEAALVKYRSLRTTSPSGLPSSLKSKPRSSRGLGGPSHDIQSCFRRRGVNSGCAWARWRSRISRELARETPSASCFRQRAQLTETRCLPAQ
jgi:hypothetical protein